jgi:hypothetical protein
MLPSAVHWSVSRAASGALDFELMPAANDEVIRNSAER